MIKIKKKERYFEGMTFIDLFAGLGGFRLALESLGGKCVYSNEWDKDVNKVYKANFGESPHAEDITKVDASTIPDHDILCAGFPCQAFSISGKQYGFTDTRGTLFFDVARIVKEKKPKIVFMENVKNFAAHDEGRTILVIQKTMEELGYTFQYKILNSAEFGAPTKRERCYMVCFRKDLGIEHMDYPEPNLYGTKTVKDVLLTSEKQVKNLYVERDDMVLTKEDIEEPTNKPYRLGHIGEARQGERIYSVNGVAITLSANGGGVFAKTGGYLMPNGKVRRLHPRECARIMGFPDKYKIDENNNRAWKQIGNSVVVDILQILAKQIGKTYKEHCD